VDACLARMNLATARWETVGEGGLMSLKPESKKHDLEIKVLMYDWKRKGK